MHPGGRPAFLRRIIKKNLDIQAFFTVGLEAVEVLRGREGNRKGADTVSLCQNPPNKTDYFPKVYSGVILGIWDSTAY